MAHEYTIQLSKIIEIIEATQDNDRRTLTALEDSEGSAANTWIQGFYDGRIQVAGHVLTMLRIASHTSPGDAGCLHRPHKSECDICRNL